MNELGIDVLDLADQSDVDVDPRVGIAFQEQLLAADERAILPCQSDRLAALLIDQSDDFLVELTQHHLDDVHRLLVGDAHPLLELALDAHLVEQPGNLRTRAVDDDRIQSDELQHRHVAGEASLQLLVDHGVAAQLDHDRLLVEAADVGKRFGENLRLLRGRGGTEGHRGLGSEC